MKKFFLMSAFAAITATAVFAQTTIDTTGTVKTTKRDWSKLDLSDRANDHFMIQFGYQGWAGKPDTIQTKGISRFFNMYVMLDKPFKTDPRFSVGFGLGFSLSNILFDNTVIDITGKKTTSRINFQNADSSDHYKKYRLVNAWVEVPIELRYVSNPENSDKSWKYSIGAKVGTMFDAHTRGREPVDKSGNTLSGQSKVVIKEKSRKFFNSTRIAGTARIGYGHFSLYGDFQLNTLFKEGVGPAVRPFSIGLAISGL